MSLSLLSAIKQKRLDFVFTPDGVIRGCVTASLEPEDKSSGMPDYRYRSLDTNKNLSHCCIHLHISINMHSWTRLVSSYKNWAIQNTAQSCASIITEALRC